MTPTAGSAVLTQLPDVWQLTFDNLPDEEFVDGLRLSTDCLCRRLVEPLEPDRYHEFPEHLGHRGHGFERVMQEWLVDVMGATTVLREIVVPWEYGETHLDLLVDPEAAARLFGCTHGGWLLIELKANKDAQVRSENVRQAQRQRFAIERAVAADKPIRFRQRVTGTVRTLDDGHGTPVVEAKARWEWAVVPKSVMENLEYRVIVIDPTTWRIPDPKGTRITILDDRRAALEAEWEAMRVFMSLKPAAMRWNVEWPNRMPPCTCSKCFPLELEELPKELAPLCEQYLEAMEEEKFAKEQKALIGAPIRSGVKRLNHGEPGTWAGHGFKATLDKRGALRVNRSDAKAMPRL